MSQTARRLGRGTKLNDNGDREIDESGNLTQLADAVSGKVLDYDYDAINRLTCVGKHR